MPQDERKPTVWILGAGFSRSLGGPLLRDMFTLESSPEVHTRFPEELKSLPSKEVYRLYQEHAGEAGAQKPGMWRDAEAFLDYLDTAVKPGVRNDIIRRLARRSGHEVSIEHLASTARRLMAAECAGFVLDADLESEPWQPYIKWARQLDSRDTIITFNYDTAVELLNNAGAKIFTMTTRRQVGSHEGHARLLKLHGSLDWRFGETEQEPAIVVNPHDPLLFLKCKPESLTIASPGPTKRKTASRLGEIWDIATDAITAAREIYFIGYRFPPSDSEARGRLLAAVEANNNDPLCSLVLGHNVRDPWVERIRQLVDTMLARAASTRRNYHSEVKALPFLAEDFFSVWKRDAPM